MRAKNYHPILQTRETCLSNTVHSMAKGSELCLHDSRQSLHCKSKRVFTISRTFQAISHLLSATEAAFLAKKCPFSPPPTPSSTNTTDLHSAPWPLWPLDSFHQVALSCCFCFSSVKFFRVRPCHIHLCFPSTKWGPGRRLAICEYLLNEKKVWEGGKEEEE